MPRSLGKKDISVATRLRVVLFLAESSVCGMVLRGAVCAAVKIFIATTARQSILGDLDNNRAQNGRQFTKFRRCCKE
ncbi:hypothetical protein GQ600_11317 [Phytophthora cactorum]|nr:hypothetical protein GQ600_11317 [Phytophthora cactorum]